MASEGIGGQVSMTEPESTDMAAKDREVFVSSESEGPLRQKSLLTHKAPASQNQTKVYPGDIHADGSSQDRSRATTPSSHGVLKLQLDLKTLLLQLALAIALCVCLAWTLWLLLLNVAPNDTVNRVMNTESFDSGSFWLLVDQSSALVVLATFGLAVVALSYLFILITMFFRRKSKQEIYAAAQSPTSKLASLKKRVEKALDDAAAKPKRGKVASSAVKLAASLARDGSSARKFIVRSWWLIVDSIIVLNVYIVLTAFQQKIWLKIGDLVLETTMLYQMLEAGSPAVLLGIFTVIVASNALACAGMMFLPFEHTRLIETLVDIMCVHPYVFDLLIAIGYLMLVLFYCFSTFSFDRAKFAINLEVFLPGWFEQEASIIADPVQTAVIYRCLKSLRIASVLDFFTRVGVNATLCFRLRYLVKQIQDPRKQQGSVYPKRHRAAAALFMAFAALLVVFVEESIRTSTLACRPHPECAVNARRWTFLESDSMTQCPCLILIDRDIGPKTFAEWEQPKNVTDKVTQLATMGELQTLQLVNRYLPVLPDELRRCTEMKHL
ncbi:hypothetical protein BBJ28_00019747 [Nothophytophthora sp. Chile5]|nr:hypothetical protein BBJ28_00019747 [Nothophytophthora sp. Chile5]